MRGEAKEKGGTTMDTNFAAWMIGGGPRIETEAAERQREHLRAFRESQRREHVGLIDRLRGISRPKETEVDLICCTA
jgi:hypothetical protein